MHVYFWFKCLHVAKVNWDRPNRKQLLEAGVIELFNSRTGVSQ